MPRIVPVILCGGEGKRLSPISTPAVPKQFLAWGQKTLFQQAIERAASISDEIIIVTNERYKSLVASQIMPGIKYHYIFEPSSRNTAPSIILSALYAEKHFPDALLCILPADHIINNPKVLVEGIFNAASISQQKIGLFGITPSHASTQYGYIMTGEDLADGCFKVARFIEKPESNIAADLIKQGCLWNSGIFLAAPKTLLAEARTHISALYSMIERAFLSASEEDNIFLPGRRYFDSLTPTQIDKSVLQHSECLVVKPVNLLWDDIGSIESLIRQQKFPV